MAASEGPPKFPQAPIFTFLWGVYLRSRNEKARDAVLTTLTQISNGGIFLSHLAGGIARYSTDHIWLAPHFEKMLYDNAQLSHPARPSPGRETGSPLLRARALHDTIGLAPARHDSCAGGCLRLQSTMPIHGSTRKAGSLMSGARIQLARLLGDRTRPNSCQAAYDVIAGRKLGRSAPSSTA